MLLATGHLFTVLILEIFEVPEGGGWEGLLCVKGDSSKEGQEGNICRLVLWAWVSFRISF